MVSNEISLYNVEYIVLITVLMLLLYSANVKVSRNHTAVQFGLHYHEQRRRKDEEREVVGSEGDE